MANAPRTHFAKIKPYKRRVPVKYNTSRPPRKY